jgi:hypothetical protein
MSIVIFCILVLFVCLQVSVFDACYSIRIVLLRWFLQWSEFLTAWCLFLGEMRITMEEWLVLEIQKWPEQDAMWRYEEGLDRIVRGQKLSFLCLSDELWVCIVVLIVFEV